MVLQYRLAHGILRVAIEIKNYEPAICSKKVAATSVSAGTKRMFMRPIHE
jgi:hypothetical protein